MSKREEKAKLLQKEQMLAIKRKNITDFWLRYTAFFRPWLHELTRQYKEKADYPAIASWLLPSNYTDKKDQEVAAIASILIRDGYCDGVKPYHATDEQVRSRVRDFRILMGEKPFDWFRNREFVSLGMGRKQEMCTGGITNAKIAEYLNLFYTHWGNRVGRLSELLLDFFGPEIAPIKERMLRLVLGASDGIGLAIWDIVPPIFKCPLSQEIMEFLREFLPEYYVKGRGGGLFTFDEAVHLFGFDKDYDFFYAMLAYKDLQRRNPMGCRRFLTAYQKEYEEGNLRGELFWSGKNGILPKV